MRASQRGTAVANGPQSLILREPVRVVIVVDRVDRHRKVREHKTEDGRRTLCGLVLTSVNATLAGGNLRCTRCIRMAGRWPMKITGGDPEPASVVAVLDGLAGALERVDGRLERSNRLGRLRDSTLSAVLDELTSLEREAIDVMSAVLIATAGQVLRGERTVQQLRRLCERGASE